MGNGRVWARAGRSGFWLRGGGDAVGVGLCLKLALALLGTGVGLCLKVALGPRLKARRARPAHGAHGLDLPISKANIIYLCRGLSYVHF